VETEISKGGEDWGTITVDRRSKGIEVWARLDPKIEELVASASEGQGSYSNAMETFGRNWVGINPTPDIKIYSLERPLDGATYYLSGVCGALKDGKGRTNLSFLTMAGIGKPEGVRFLILGPAQADQVKEYGKNVVRDITYFLREYLIPVHIGMNIIVSNRF
jgi:hypothetical protein